MIVASRSGSQSFYENEWKSLVEASSKVSWKLLHHTQHYTPKGPALLRLVVTHACLHDLFSFQIRVAHHKIFHVPCRSTGPTQGMLSGTQARLDVLKDM